MKCPFCEKTCADPHHEKAEVYCQNYGPAYFYFQCPHCRKIYSVNFHVVITHDKPCKEPEKSVADMSYD